MVFKRFAFRQKKAPQMRCLDKFDYDNIHLSFFQVISCVFVAKKTFKTFQHQVSGQKLKFSLRCQKILITAKVELVI